jgi:hypothetical protein
VLRLKLGQVSDSLPLSELRVNERNLKIKLLKHHGQEMTVAAGGREYYELLVFLEFCLVQNVNKVRFFHIARDKTKLLL